VNLGEMPLDSKEHARALAMIRLAAEQLGMSFTEDGRPVA